MNASSSTGRRSRRAVFLDKDGTLIVDVPYNVNPDRIALAPGAVEGLTALAEAGFQFVVVSNQSGVARGHFAIEDLAGVERRIRNLLSEHGIELDGFYFCPHFLEGSVMPYAIACECRKPRPGMLLQASRDLDLDLKSSWMIGDILNDVEAGGRAGCKTVFLDNGGETEWIDAPLRRPTLVAADLQGAARRILDSP